jgi:NADP-dependent 3-hydroxy acid dehydrogenase YdfG
MKIAITGHTSGIGQALAEAYYGHEIVGLSKRDGNNIRNVQKIANLIEPCDVFINNAQEGFAQTELLFEMHRRWIGQDKHIIVISTMMTQQPVSVIAGMDEYRSQKVALEDAVKQLRYLNRNPDITIVRPGRVDNPAEWARTLVKLFNTAEANGFAIPDISLR